MRATATHHIAGLGMLAAALLPLPLLAILPGASVQTMPSAWVLDKVYSRLAPARETVNDTDGLLEQRPLDKRHA